jgi:4-diphosphocytidyl-2-C-methyl-D-erythritol kinase
MKSDQSGVIRAQAHAKLNFSLCILGRRPDGFHQVETVLHAIDLCDELTLTPTKGEVKVECNVDIEEETNLCRRSALLLREATGCRKGVHMKLQKKIPTGSGLAGGSSDAAATLQALNALWELGLSKEELAEVGARLGCDIPFFLWGGTALGTNRGDMIRPLDSHPRLWFVLAKPQFEVPTAWAYRELDRYPLREPMTEQMLSALTVGSPQAIAQALHNDLEEPVMRHHAELAELKKQLLEAGCLGAALCGSGSAVFGVAKDRLSAREALKKVEGATWKAVVRSRRSR